MFGRKFLTMFLLTVLALALLTGALQADHGAGRNADFDTIRSTLHNIQDYVAPLEQSGIHFAVEDDALFAGTPSRWQRVETPANVLVSTVAVDYADGHSTPTIYIGAVNELAIYHSQDFGENWVHTPLAIQVAGGITEVTLDPLQKILYVGTDTSGIYRLRDAGSALRINNHVLIEQPIIEIETDSGGNGIAYARTEWQLYRADRYGMRWFAIEGLPSVPTALAIANTTPATVYVGTIEQGIFKSTNGKEWTPHNRGLQYGAGNRLKIDALAVDQLDSSVLYVSASHLFGSRNTQVVPAGVFMTTDSTTWDIMLAAEEGQQPIVDLFPVHGKVGTLFAMTEQRSDLQTVAAEVQLAQSTVDTNSAVAETATESTWNRRTVSWIVAGLAALALLFAALSDIRRRSPVTAQQPITE